MNILNQQKLVPMRMVIEKLVKCTGSKDNLRKIITLLLEYGAPVHIITDDANGDTAFHAIVRLFPPEWDLASTFLEHGASVVKPNYLGEKVRDITVVSKRMDVLLKDKSSKCGIWGRDGPLWVPQRNEVRPLATDPSLNSMGPSYLPYMCDIFACIYAGNSSRSDRL